MWNEKIANSFVLCVPTARHSFGTLCLIQLSLTNCSYSYLNLNHSTFRASLHLTHTLSIRQKWIPFYKRTKKDWKYSILTFRGTQQPLRAAMCSQAYGWLFVPLKNFRLFFLPKITFRTEKLWEWGEGVTEQLRLYLITKLNTKRASSENCRRKCGILVT